MSINKQVVNLSEEKEWFELMTIAKSMGISIDDIKEFLRHSTENEDPSQNG